MKIQIANSYCYVFEPTEEEKQTIRDCCKYRIPNFQYTYAGKRGWGDGMTTVLIATHNKLCFPTGMLPIITEKLKSQPEIQDMRTIPKIQQPILLRHALRDYQQECVDKAVPAVRGVIECPTGGGKTAIMMGIIARLNLRTLIITNKVDMLNQLSEEGEKWLGYKLGRIGNKLFDIQPVTVATIQSIAKRGFIAELSDFEVLMIDEYHHAGAETYLKSLNREQYYYRYGFTATNYRNDEASVILSSITGGCIHKVERSFLEEEGYLVPAYVKMIEIGGEKVYGDQKKDYAKIYDAGIVENSYRNGHIIGTANYYLDFGMSVLILVTKIRHGELLAEAGNFLFLNGSHKGQYRADVKQAMKDGKLNCVIATSIWDEGVDIPNMNVVIFAGGGKSKVLVVQRAGRVLRPASGKDKALVIDFYDTCHEVLTWQSRSRLAIYRKQGFVLEPKYRTRSKR